MNDNFVVKDSGQRQDYPSGMRRDIQTGKPNYNLIDNGFLTRLAEHLTKGADKYGRDNWRKANSQEEYQRFLDSAHRHLIQYLDGKRDEDHMSAVCFNLMAAEHCKAKMEEKNTYMDKLHKAIMDVVRGVHRALLPRFYGLDITTDINTAFCFVDFHIRWDKGTIGFDYRVEMEELLCDGVPHAVIYTIIYKILNDTQFAIYNVTPAFLEIKKQADHVLDSLKAWFRTPEYSVRYEVLGEWVTFKLQYKGKTFGYTVSPRELHDLSNKFSAYNMMVEDFEDRIANFKTK